MRKKSFFHKMYCSFIKIFIRRTKFIYLGEEIQDKSLILSNHVGASAPLSLELFHKKTFRFWGTHEMNGSYKEVYNYLSKIYFYKKKHINKYISKILAFIAAPFLRLFYRGLNLLPTYTDARTLTTIKNSYNSLSNNQSIVIFPEKSENGYFKVLKGFHPGFALLLEYCYKKGLDVMIYLSYYNKRTHTQIFDKPVKYSDIKNNFNSRKEMAEYFCNRCNELGEILKNKQYLKNS